MNEGEDPNIILSEYDNWVYREKEWDQDIPDTKAYDWYCKYRIYTDPDFQIEN